MRILVLIASALSLVSCSSNTRQTPKQAQTAEKVAAKPSNESRRFPQANLVSTQVFDSAILGKSFMPGGTLARYRKGKTEYQMFVARADNSTDAAIKVNDWRKALTKPEFIASYGGYFGEDAGVPVFVFSKGEWIAGVVGLPLREADAAARPLASRL